MAIPQLLQPDLYGRKMEVQYEWVEQAFRPAVERPQKPASAAEVQLELLISCSDGSYHSG